MIISVKVRWDVYLIFQDYYNYSEQAHKMFQLPPLQPKFNTYIDSARSQASTNREAHELCLPKTFMTRKGAMLLFSEDMATRTKASDFR